MKKAALDLYQQQELKMLEHEVVLAKKFLAANKERFNLKAICLVIGPSRAGKSTLLAKSGLGLVDTEFNALSTRSKEITTTKSCAFWFDQNTIFIDTAGVYTRPDLTSEASSDLWLGFIKLLRQHFNKVPIRDIIAVLDLPGLLEEPLLQQNLDYLRMRIYEVASLTNKLQLHLVITKIDRILGFNDYFANLTEQLCLNPMGIVFSQQNQNGLILEFEKKFTSLLHQLNDRLLDLLHTNADLHDPVLVKAFPSELAQLFYPIETILSKIPYGAHITLKEVLLVSSCQHGAILDPIKRMMNQGFGAHDRSSYDLEYFGQRSYFIQDFFKHLKQQYTTSSSALPKKWLHNLIAAVILTLSLGAFRLLYVNFKYQQQLLKTDTSLIAKAALSELPKKTPWWVLYRVDSGIVNAYARLSDFQLIAKLNKQLESYLSQLMQTSNKLETNLMILDAYYAYLILTDQQTNANSLRWLSDYLKRNTTINRYFTNKQRHKLYSLLLKPASFPKGTSYLRDKALEQRVENYIKQLSHTERLTLAALTQQLVGREELLKLITYMDSPLVREVYLRKLSKALSLRLAAPSRITQVLAPLTLNEDSARQLMGYLLGFLSGNGLAAPVKVTARTQLSSWHSSFYAWLQQRVNTSINKRQRILWQAIIEQWEEDYQRLMKDPKLYHASLSKYLKQLHEGELDGVILPFSSMLENWIINNQPASLKVYQVWQNSFWQIIARLTKEEMVAEWNQKIVPFFQHKLAAFYPLQPDSHREVHLDNFNHFFGPKGLIAGFQQKWVEPFTYISDQMPVWLNLNDREQLFSLAILEAVTRSRLITQSFYDADGKLALNFVLLAQNSSKQTLAFKMDLDGQKISVHDAAPQKLTWPGPKPGSVVLSGRTENGGHLMQSFVGSWALFRVLEQQAQLNWNKDQLADLKITLLDPSSPGRSYTWRFTLHDLNKFNPLSLKLLRKVFLEPVE